MKHYIGQRDQFPLYIAKRYLFGGKGGGFTSFLTAVAILGVAIGTAALVTVTSVMSGFSTELEKKLMGFSSHVSVTAPTEIPQETVKKITENFENVESVTPFVTGEAIVETRGAGTSSAMGVKVLGLEKIPERMLNQAKFFWAGSMLGKLWWHEFLPPLEYGAVVGDQILYSIGAHPDFGDTILLVAPFGGIDPMGNPVPHRREYKVTGGFKSGLLEYDYKYVILSFDEAKRLLRTQARYGLQIELANGGSTRFIKELQDFLGEGFEVQGWDARNKRLFSALKLERVAMVFLLSLVIVIASFSIVGVALMIFFSKRKSLAVLFSMGASRRCISRIFVFYGGLIGLIGAVLGLTGGITTALLIRKSNIVLPPSYYLDHLPVTMNGLSLVAIGAVAVLISVLAAYYPSRKAAEVDPLELIRYE